MYLAWSALNYDTNQLTPQFLGRITNNSVSDAFNAPRIQDSCSESWRQSTVNVEISAWG